jgi:hypothetical protein
LEKGGLTSYPLVIYRQDGRRPLTTTEAALHKTDSWTMPSDCGGRLPNVEARQAIRRRCPGRNRHFSRQDFRLISLVHDNLNILLLLTVSIQPVSAVIEDKK